MLGLSDFTDGGAMSAAIIEEISLPFLIAFWRDVRENIRECLKATPDDLFAWAPKEGMQTFGRLYVHLSTAVIWWLSKYVQDGGPWITSDELSKTDRQEIDANLVQTFARVERFAREGDLARTYEYKGRSVTGAWILMHLFEHDVHHRAQLKVYLRENGIAPPSS